MEAEEEVAPLRLPLEGKNKEDRFPIAKGKRTKRYRLHSPIAFTIKTPSITEDYNSTPTTNSNLHGHHHHHPISPSSVSSEESTTTREEDTARCLILLARGHNFSEQYQPNNVNNNSKRHLENDAQTHANATTVVNGGGNKTKGSCMYVCKTCNRAFSSFQALGGHRASHKKPRNEKRLALIFGDHGDDFPSPPSGSSSKNRWSPNYSLSLQLSNFSTTTASASATTKSSPSPRIHVCSHCGAEFTSGQALGGHMRRHRAGPIGPSPNPPAACICNEEPEPENEELKTPKNGLSLDLNLPAPEVVDRQY